MGAIRFRLLSLGLLCLATQGCSAIVANGGAHVENVLRPGKSDQAIQTMLGAPTGRFIFPEPIPAYQVYELAKLGRYDERLQLETPILGYADYQFTGWVYNPEAYQVFGMAAAFTLGISEFVLFPSLIGYTIDQSHIVHRYRVWYRTDHTYFAHISSDHWTEWRWVDPSADKSPAGGSNR
jgi:hypothetical protein